MSRISKAVSDMRTENTLRKSETVTNFMGGDSYKLDPLTTLKMVSASSIFGEKAYYVNGGTPSNRDTISSYNYVAVLDCMKPELLIDTSNKTTEDVMEKAIDDALSFDFRGTLDWAVELRNEYNIRLNPQVIMVRAALHPDREKFTKEFNGAFGEINSKVMARADDSMNQLSYFLYKNGGKKNAIPSILKRSWAKHLGSLSRYQVAKYAGNNMGMIDAVRICHAKGPIISELMQRGKVEFDEDQQTWEKLRVKGVGWAEIYRSVNMGHMALLRNLRGFFCEVSDIELARDYLNKLKLGVESGKQFPFRYFTAYKIINKLSDAVVGATVGVRAGDKAVYHKQLILDTLEECIDISVNNMPRIPGRVMCLSDNSGSAWGTINSEYGTVTVAEIDNLSSVITAACSDEGYVGKFGDKLNIYPISKWRGILEQTMEITKNRDNDVGGGTEGGIWEFFSNAISNMEHWDTIFIYSDQQAGTGGLYGTSKHMEEYKRAGYDYGHNINVFKLVLDYRKIVNDKVNVFSVQTAGYNNSVLPQYAYRTNLLYGWTGKEALFADIIIHEWNEFDKKQRGVGKK